MLQQANNMHRNNKASQSYNKDRWSSHMSKINQFQYCSKAAEQKVKKNKKHDTTESNDEKRFHWFMPVCI